MLTIYTTEKCKACDILKERCKNMNIKFKERHVNLIPKQYKRLLLGGIPIIFKNNKPLSNKEIEKLFIKKSFNGEIYGKL